MEAERALELVKQGATLLLLDVPQFTLFGIDTQMFSVGPVFKGIKMIPPGPHFVYYSSSNRDGNDFSLVVGFFINTNPSEVIVRKWVQQEERLVKLSEEEEERYCVAVKNLEFDSHLGPYPLKHYGDWKQISNYITKSTIERIEPIGGEITVACESGLVDAFPKTSMEKALAEQLKNNSKFSETAEKSNKRGCYYTSIPRVVKNKGISGQNLTSLNLDKTQLLETILLKDYGGSEDLLLGELQFSFIAFLMGQSLEAFLQWKDLVTLLFSCTEAPFHTRSQLFTKFIKVIYYELKFGLQKDHKNSGGAKRGASVFLDDSWFCKDSFLHHLCKDFFSLVQEASAIDGDLLSWTRNFEQLLQTTLGWDFQQNRAADGFYEEDDEFAPVVENLDDTSLSEAPAA
ncbi:A1 cistron-splicing factor [Macleaya cordata]|uniref:A1 cistron-splicing factor n=1 Tax=Macleaya cordata TaxID=56857 RepID=A0A200R7T4_MACCD|nr:A1 cistron-splicing factor [Macleaya cordata]